MANNVNLKVKKPGHIDGSVEAVELPADLLAVLADHEQAEVLLELIASPKTKYTLFQHS